MIDFIIVGRGLAATSLMHAFYQHQISFKVIGSEQLSNCSRVAAGIWNPVVFKRLTKSWLADELIPQLHTFYTECEARLNVRIMTRRPLLKPFTEDQEKKLWTKKAASELKDFIDPDLYSPASPDLDHCHIPNQYGLVNNCGNIHVADYLAATTTLFKDHIRDERFNHAQLQFIKDTVNYEDLKAKHIIFCEGYLVKDNPFFNWIPLKPAKGEILTIQSSGLRLKHSILNRNGFLMDISGNTFRVGATYDWNDLSQQPTEKGLEELRIKLKTMISCEYSVLRHEAGIRPSSIDRRPVIGPHPLHKNAFVFNGLGTKGVMLAPFFVKNFVNFFLQKEALVNDVNVNRFYHLYEQKK